MKKIPILLFLLLPLSVWAQRYSVSGYVTDAETGESLIGANILNVPSREGSAANTYGFYSLTLSGDSVQLRFSYVGYESKQTRFFLQKDTLLNISLQAVNRLEEVVVQADRPIEESTQMSRIDVPIAEIKALPALLGEVDVLKAIQLLPGVQSGSEGSSGLYVRDGGPDQNLILLDGVPVYNASHLFGFFSVFNADAINKVELVKGGFRTVPSDWTILENSLYVKAFNASPSYYLYQTTLNRNHENDGNPFAEPSPVYTNVEGGYGILGSLSPSSKEL